MMNSTDHSPRVRPRFEFHISRKARQRYQFDEGLYSLTGNVIFADYRAVRALADKMNLARDARRNPDQAVRAGQLNAMGLIDEILHFVAARFRAERNPNAMAKALNWLGERLGQDALDRTLLEFVTLFPPLAVHQGRQTASQYLGGQTGDYPHRCIVLEEMMLLHLANENPAFAPFMELFDDGDLDKQPGYVGIKSLLDEFFRAQPTYGPYNQTLTDLLRAPVKASPYSLTGQLLYIKEHWRFFIPGEMLDRLVHRLLVALDYIQE